MTERRQRCLLYMRQSLGRPGETAETSLSLESQEDTLNERAASERWIVVKAIRDHDLKGDDPNREGMIELLDAAQSGVADILLVFNLSRFARDNLLQELTYRRLVGMGVKVVSIAEPNIEHTLFRGMLGVMNQYASEQTAQFVRAAFRARVERGLTHGPAPYGYRKVNKRMLLDDEEAPVVRRIFARWLDGAGVAAIAAEIEAGEHRPRRAETWSLDRIRAILHNPAYAGSAHISGNVRPGLHEAIIPREDWDRAQELFDIRPQTRHDERPSWCEGLVYHSCGQRMYLQPMNTPSDNRAPVWQYVCRSRTVARQHWCTDARPRIVPWKLEPAVRDALAADLSRRYPAEQVIATYRESAGGSDAEQRRAEIAKRRDAIDKRLGRAESLYLNGNRSAAWLVEQERQAGDEMAALAAEEAALPQLADPTAIARADTLFAELDETIAHLPGDTLRGALEECGVVIVSDAGASIRYMPEVAGFFPPPVVIPYPTGWGPNRLPMPKRVPD